MKKICILVLCLVLTLVTFGCGNKSVQKPTNLQDTYSAVGNYFGDSSVDRSNLGAFYLDEENNIIVKLHICDDIHVCADKFSRAHA